MLITIATALTVVVADGVTPMVEGVPTATVAAAEAMVDPTTQSETSRYQRIEERQRTPRWAPNASPATHGGKIGTITDLRQRFQGRTPHRESLQQLRERRRTAEAKDRMRESERSARLRTRPAPATVGEGKSHCRTADLCVDAPTKKTRRSQMKWQRRSSRSIVIAALQGLDSLVEGTHCRRGICTDPIRSQRIEERRSFRWAPAADPPTHGGQPTTVGELRARFDGQIPHRRILRVRTEIKKDLTKEKREEAFAGRILQHLDLPVPDTIGADKSHCLLPGVCVDPIKRRLTEQPMRPRWGKAKERASFFGGGVERRKDAVDQRFGLKYTKRRRDQVPIAQRGDPPPQMRNQRFY